MNRIYDGSIVNVDGIDFLVTIGPDEFTGPPWTECDGHGPVDCRDHSPWGQFPVKMPGEIIIGKYRGDVVFYDFQEAVKIARRDGWNYPPYFWKTKGEQAAAAARADADYLKRWLNGRWEYVFITVHPLDDYSEILPMSASIGGVEYDPDDTGYIGSVVEDLAREVIAEHEFMFSAPLPKVEQVISTNDLLTLPDFAAKAA